MPHEARLGTVDKFQGQEASIVIYSVTCSTAADAPRGMAFLLAYVGLWSWRLQRGIFLDFFSRHHDAKRHTQTLEMLLTAADFVGFARAEF